MNDATSQASRVAKGAWVQVRTELLAPSERAPAIPADTSLVPYIVLVKGFADSDGVIGGEVTILTPAGRRLAGTIVEADPRHQPTFGSPVPELATIGLELRRILDDEPERRPA